MASCETEVSGCKFFNIMHEHLNFAQLFEIVALSSDRPIQRVWPAFRYSSGGFVGYFLRHVSSLKQLRTSGARCTELNQHALISGRCRDIARLYVNDADAKACTYLQLTLVGGYTPQSVHHAENGAQDHRN
jgi:hypothetical protein